MSNIFKTLTVLIILSVFFPVVHAEDKYISLKKPPAKINSDLLQALWRRKSVRKFSDRKISEDHLSLILWAAYGQNRNNGKKTIPTAFGRDHMRVFIAARNGVYRYDPKGHRLVYISGENVMKKLSMQKWVNRASHILIIVSEPGRLPGLVPIKMRTYFSHTAAGAMAQNVYLMAESLKMGTCIIGGIRPDSIRRSLGLSKKELPLYIMPLGYLK